MVVTMVCLYGISRCISEVINKRTRKNGKMFVDLSRAFQYVVGVILSQGKYSLIQTTEI